MNERALMPSPGDPNQGTWVDAYMPENRLAVHQPKQMFINLDEVRGILFRQRWVIATVLVVAAVAGVVLTILSTPMYEARSSVRIEPYGSYVIEGQVEQSIASNQVYDLLATHMGVITSRSLANVIAEELNLGAREDFLGESFDDSRPPSLTDAQWLAMKQDAAAEKLHSSVSAEIPDNNWIIEIAYRSQDPAIAAEMANAYSAAFASMETRETLDNNEYAREYLEEQIGVVRQRLQEAEQAANQYARANGIIVQASPAGAEEGAAVTLTNSNLTNINARVSAAQAARIEAEQRWRSVENLPPSQLAEVQNNSLLQSLISDRAIAQGELAELRQRYYDAHPLAAAKISQIETLEAEIDRTSSDIKSAIRNAYVIARNQEQALRAELNATTGESLAEQDRQVEYSVLEREAQALRDQLQALLTRFNEISTASTLQTNTVIPLDSAVVPRSPYSPSLLRNLAIALVLGAAVAGALAVLREILDDKIRSMEDVEERVGIPLLGQTPYISERDMEDESDNRFGMLIEAYSSIRSTIDYTVPRDRSLIQLTSCQQSEGKSTTAMILSELFAGMGRKTLLIDADLRRPSIANLLKSKRPENGLVEVVLGHSDLESALVKGEHESLDILCVAERPANPAELLASAEMKQFLETCRNKYSLVIVDSCPVLGLADAPNLARVVDGTIFVMEANRIGFREVRTAIRRLRATGGNPIGGILTKYRALEAGESYNYQYSYYEYGEKPKSA